MEVSRTHQGPAQRSIFHLLMRVPPECLLNLSPTLRPTAYTPDPVYLSDTHLPSLFGSLLRGTLIPTPNPQSQFCFPEGMEGSKRFIQKLGTTMFVYSELTKASRKLLLCLGCPLNWELLPVNVSPEEFISFILEFPWQLLPCLFSVGKVRSPAPEPGRSVASTSVKLVVNQDPLVHTEAGTCSHVGVGSEDPQSWGVCGFQFSLLRSGLCRRLCIPSGLTCCNSMASRESW